MQPGLLVQSNQVAITQEPTYTPDDTSRFFVGAGIVTDEADIINCRRCGFSVMPWMAFCEACGKNPHYAEPDRPYGCILCGETYECIEDAEMCCAPVPEYECDECERLHPDPDAATRCCLPSWM